MGIAREDVLRLTTAARAARQHAYAPYSEHQLGAALLTHTGEIIAAGNVENSCYALTVCAERAVFYRALAGGWVNFRALLIHSDSAEPIPPCGACRQVIWELAGDIEIIMVGTGSRLRKTSLAQLFPEPYKQQNRHRLKRYHRFRKKVL